MMSAVARGRLTFSKWTFLCRVYNQNQKVIIMPAATTPALISTPHHLCSVAFSSTTSSNTISPSAMKSAVLVEQMTLKEKGSDARPFSGRQKKLLVALMNEDETWSDVVIKNPDLLSLGSHSAVLELVDSLLYHGGASEAEARDFLAVCPKEILSRKELLEEHLAAWILFCKREELNWLQVLTDAPDIVYLGWDHFMERKFLLRAVIGPDNVAAAVENSPSVLLEPWNVVQEKIYYCYHTMHACPKSVAESGALAYDIEHMSNRYLFLDRCGLYRHPHPKSVGIHESAEPAIDVVVDTDDRTFLEKAAGGLLTIEEYNTFLCSLQMGADADEVFVEGADYDEDDEDDYEGRSTHMSSDFRSEKEAKLARKKKRK